METKSSSLESPEQRAFRMEVRRWFEENLPPGWGTPVYQQPKTDREMIDFLRAWQRKLYDGGWAGLSWPREYGGRGVTLMEQAIFLEERDRAKAPLEWGVVGIGMVGPMLIHEGSEQQRRRYLQPILTGEELWCQGFSEPNAGSDLAALRTRAVRDGDEFVISGQKVWTSRASDAQLMILLARTDFEAPKHKGITAFIVPVDSPGLRLVPIQQINNTNEFCEVFLDSVPVPAENVIGAVNQGWQIALRTLSYERVVTTRAFEARRMLVDLVRACMSRPPDGREPSISDPIVRSQLAQLHCEVQAARVAYYQGIARVMKAGAPGPEESAGKLHTSELCKRIGDTASAVLGPAGVRGRVEQSIGGDPSWPYEYVTTLKHTIAAGTSQVMRNILGERVLGLPR